MHPLTLRALRRPGCCCLRSYASVHRAGAARARLASHSPACAPYSLRYACEGVLWKNTPVRKAYFDDGAFFRLLNQYAVYTAVFIRFSTRLSGNHHRYSAQKYFSYSIHFCASTTRQDLSSNRHHLARRSLAECLFFLWKAREAMFVNEITCISTGHFILLLSLFFLHCQQKVLRNFAAFCVETGISTIVVYVC